MITRQSETARNEIEKKAEKKKLLKAHTKSYANIGIQDRNKWFALHVCSWSHTLYIGMGTH